ncbi:MAG: ArsA family ATPase [Desulfobacterales bacterium]|nr:MAG: ArsA family ATPase [Desulfobacterales bacterium]
MRIIFFAGKGGVGKTSVAAATGIKAAQMGHRTVIMSLDAAHSLSDIFDLSRDLLDHNKGAPIAVQANLWIQELDIQEAIQNYWGEIHKYLTVLFQTTGMDEILAEEFAILPGMEEVSLLLYINQYVQAKQFDVIILDCAPTGESIRFISIPNTLEWYMQKIFKLERRAAKYLRPVAKRVYDLPLPDDDYFQAIEYLFERLRGVDGIIKDPRKTTIRLVTNPEKIVIKETQRAFMYFCLYKMSIDGIIINRILPDDVTDDYFHQWKADQRHYIDQAEQYFSPIPIFSVRLFQEEILGYERLGALAEHIYGDRNPLERFFEGEPYYWDKQNGAYRLRLKLPFIGKGDVQLHKHSDELIVRLGSFKRRILLPRNVAAAMPSRAKLEDQFLSVYFEGGDHEQKRR